MAERKAPNWKKIKAEYLKGGISQRKLAEKYGVSINTLRKKASDEKWAAERDELYTKVTPKIHQKIEEKTVEESAKDNGCTIGAYGCGEQSSKQIIVSMRVKNHLLTSTEK